MKSLVIYTTTSGNTETIAEAIAAALREYGAVEVIDAAQAPTTLPNSDLVLIGGPTERHTLTEPLVHFFDRLAPGSLVMKAAAAFDTRLRWPRFLSGSASDEIATRLRAAGARIAAPPESFFVSTKPKLEPGEIARAGTWASAIADKIDVPEAVRR